MKSVSMLIGSDGEIRLPIHPTCLGCGLMFEEYNLVPWGAGEIVAMGMDEVDGEFCVIFLNHVTCNHCNHEIHCDVKNGAAWSQKTPDGDFEPFNPILAWFDKEYTQV